VETNESLEQILQEMGIEMEKLGTQPLTIRDTCIAGAAETDFKKDLDWLTTAIAMRLQRENTSSTKNI
jgi:hypothetical protein